MRRREFLGRVLALVGLGAAAKPEPKRETLLISHLKMMGKDIPVHRTRLSPDGGYHVPQEFVKTLLVLMDRGQLTNNQARALIQ